MTRYLMKMDGRRKETPPKKLDFFCHTFWGSSILVRVVFIFICIVMYLVLFNLQTKLIKTIKAISNCSDSQETKVYIIL